VSAEEAELQRLRAAAPHRLARWPRGGRPQSARPVADRKAAGDEGAEEPAAEAPGEGLSAPPEQAGDPVKKRVPLVDDRPRLKILE
jgi:hypothetical protein